MAFAEGLQWLTAIAAALILVWSSTANADLSVTIHTGGVSAQAGALAFDLSDTSAVSSSLTITNFSGDYAPNGAPVLTGGAAGDLISGFTLTDSDFFNEVAVPVVFGTSLSFDLNFSFGTPGLLEFPDLLSVFLLTPDLSQSLITTSDPAGGNSILTYFIDATGSPNLSTYNATEETVTVTIGNANTVPEPFTLALIVVPLTYLFAVKRRTRKEA